MSKEELRDAIMAVADDATIIFFDARTIDLDGVELWWGESTADDANIPPTFIPVQPPHGKTVRDCVYAVSAAEVKAAPEVESCH